MPDYLWTGDIFDSNYDGNRSLTVKGVSEVNLHSILIVAVVALVTIALRFLPFWIFGGKRKTPQVVLYLGKVLPYAIMGMLVIYCLRSVYGGSVTSIISQFLACAVVAGLHIWKRNTLLSIIGGTAVYMVLVQII